MIYFNKAKTQAKGIWNKDSEASPKVMRMGHGEGSTMRKLIVGTFHLIYFGWLALED